MAANGKKKPPSAPAFVPAGEAAVSGPDIAGGESVKIDLGPTLRDEPATKVASCPAFLLKAHPERWTVMGDSIIPLFGRMVLMQGLNGVDHKGGRWKVGDARNMLEERGWRLIPLDAIPDAHCTPAQLAGTAAKSYLYTPKGRPDANLLIYTRCYPGSDRIDVDAPRYVEFCEHLQASGIIERPKLYALEAMLEKLRRDRDSLADQARDVSSKRAAADEAARVVGVVERAIEALQAQVKASAAQPAGELAMDGA